MPFVRHLALLLLLAGLPVRRVAAEVVEGTGAGGNGGRAETGEPRGIEEPRAGGGNGGNGGQEALTLPFAHRVGESWGLRFEREERQGERAGKATVSEAQARVISPYGRDLLVELCWRSVEGDGDHRPLAPRREETEQLLDERGGGCLLLRVDVRGTALELLNREEARAALARARGGALAEGAWAAAEQELLEGWNVVYGACGVPLVPSAPRVTSLRTGEVEAGEDERVLVLEKEPGRALAPRVTALAVNARTHVREAGERAASFQRTSSTRYDLASGRLSGWQLSVRQEPQHRVVERLAFCEVP